MGDREERDVGLWTYTGSHVTAPQLSFCFVSSYKHSEDSTTMPETLITPKDSSPVTPVNETGIKTKLRGKAEVK